MCSEILVASFDLPSARVSLQLKEEDVLWMRYSSIHVSPNLPEPDGSGHSKLNRQQIRMIWPSESEHRTWEREREEERERERERRGGKERMPLLEGWW